LIQSENERQTNRQTDREGRDRTSFDDRERKEGRTEREEGEMKRESERARGQGRG